MEFLNCIVRRGYSSLLRLEFLTIIFPFYKILCMNRLEFSCFADFFVCVFENHSRVHMAFFKICQYRRDCEQHSAKYSSLLSNLCPRIPSPEQYYILYCVNECINQPMQSGTNQTPSTHIPNLPIKVFLLFLSDPLRRGGGREVGRPSGVVTGPGPLVGELQNHFCLKRCRNEEEEDIADGIFLHLQGNLGYRRGGEGSYSTGGHNGMSTILAERPRNITPNAGDGGELRGLSQ